MRPSVSAWTETSASTKTRIPPRATAAPALRAAAGRTAEGSRMTRSARPSAISADPSVLPSSTRISSQVQLPGVVARSAARLRGRNWAPLRTGTMTDSTRLSPPPVSVPISIGRQGVRNRGGSAVQPDLLLVLEIAVHRPDVVRRAVQVVDDQHGRQHGVVLIVVLVHPVPADGME